MRTLLLLLAALALSVLAADPQPEIRREPVKPMAVGVPHTVRGLPEACTRIEGVFTGVAADPYKFNIIRTSPNCQPRARLLDAAKAKPSEKSGWKFNDLIRIPSAACPSQQAVVRVWRKPVSVAPPKLDAQGRSRIYLEESLQKAEANQLGAIPEFAVAMGVEGNACN